MGIGYKRMVGVWMVMTAFVGASMLAGRAQPPPEAMRQLRLADCQAPCWVGIFPGQSSVHQAYQQLNSVFGVMPQEGNTPRLEGSRLIALALGEMKARPGDNDMLIELDILRGIPREIRIPARFGNDTYLGKMPRLGDVVNLLGKPTCVMSWGVGIRGWSLIYDRADGVIEVGMKGARFIHWTQPIYFLSLRQANSPYAVNECLSPGAPLLTWGSIRVWR